MAAPEPPANSKQIEVPAFIHRLSGIVERWAGMWVRLGNLETVFFNDKLEDVAIERPVFVCGIARSGSTILLELLSTHPDVATHQYRDFPMLFTPVWWNRLLDLAPRRADDGVERAHKDGIMVTPESPEAMEEVLWMRFFDDIHQPAVSNILDAGRRQPAFEKFYRDHIRKILWIRGGRRYLSKGNYNLTRLEYILKLFPDARFVIPVREPVTHIASLMKQQRLFHGEETRDKRILDIMRRQGHFEFGLDRRAVNPGDSGRTDEILGLWHNGDEVAGWARYWAGIYGWVAETIDNNQALKDACLVVRYEDLCSRPKDSLIQISRHCGLDFEAADLDGLAGRLRFPSYYKTSFTAQEVEIIARETNDVRSSLGYPASEGAGGATAEELLKTGG